MFKNITGQKIQLFAFDISTGAAKTGDAANITAYVSKDHGAVTILGDTSATEMDATNAPGVYVFDLTQGETNADELTFSAKSSTANVSITPRFVSTVPPNFTAFSLDSSGRVDVIKVAGTTQTAGDIIGDTNDIQSRLPAALVSGRIDASVGAMAADTLTSSALATSAVTEIQTGLSTLDAAGVRTAVGLASANLDTQLTAIDDYIDTEVAAIKAKTDNLPPDPADASDVAAAIAAVKLYADRTVVRATVGSASTTTSIVTLAFSPAGAAADQFKGRIVVFDNDTATTALRGQATDITASSNAATPTLTVTALTTAPSSGDTFSVL